MTHDPAALIITVNFRHNKCTLKFLESASRLDGFNRCNLIVVDNNSGDGSVDQIRQAVAGFHNLELLVSSQNRGYFGGAKWALGEYLLHHPLPDWVIVCNNDVVWNERTFLTRLLSKNQQIEPIIAPAIISGLTGLDANPMIRTRPGWMRIVRYRILLSSYFLARLTQWLAPLIRQVRAALIPTPPAPAGHGRAIYAPHGAVFVLGRRFFEAGGFIDDGSFLFGEELRVAEMCRNFGLPIVYAPDLKVWHEENQTLGRSLTRETYLHQKNGFEYALKCYKASRPKSGSASSQGIPLGTTSEHRCGYISIGDSPK